MTAPAAVEVRLLQVPVGVWERAEQQTEALRREFALLGDEHDVPARLLRLVAELEQQYGGETSEQEEQLLDAVDAGVEVLPELVFTVPAEVGDHARALARMLDEADEHCREGAHLLTLAADDEVVRFRWWYLDQFTDQAHGQAPVPWPEYVHQA
jgi:hypothetical protein